MIRVINSVVGMRKGIIVAVVVLLNSLVLSGTWLSASTCRFEANPESAVTGSSADSPILTLTATTVAASAATDQETITETDQFRLEPNRYKEWVVSVYQAGSIRITAQWSGPRELQLRLYGPAQEDPYLDESKRSPLDVTFTVTSQMLGPASAGWHWRVRLGNRHDSLVAEGSISITVPKTLPQIKSFRTDLPLLYKELASMGPWYNNTYAASLGVNYTLRWDVDLATAPVTLVSSCNPIEPELAPGRTTACEESARGGLEREGSWGPIPTGDLGARWILQAENRHGRSEAVIKVLPKVSVGYHNAACIGCRPCLGCGKPSQTQRLAGFLTEVEQKVSGGCIRNNANLDRFNDPYLRGRMTDDILQKMKSLTIYPDDDHLPDAGGRTICETGYGYTPGDKEYIMMCLGKGADGLTLLHELEHYVDPKTDECRAAWVAQSCYGLAGPNCP